MSFQILGQIPIVFVADLCHCQHYTSKENNNLIAVEATGMALALVPSLVSKKNAAEVHGFLCLRLQ